MLHELCMSECPQAPIFAQACVLQLPPQVTYMFTLALVQNILITELLLRLSEGSIEQLPPNSSDGNSYVSYKRVDRILIVLRISEKYAVNDVALHARLQLGAADISITSFLDRSILFAKLMPFLGLL